ncbi:hypothetical protein CFN78_21995 [Amycolatopsis antarctica]|uniref:Ester cyclase n=1 Tax=Amycolatopsis antarctica TaxID=1854586 RepID=A0A263CYK6_9PSEU|nr:ester cyclase [Amycolatopsis antarctica]OZM71191.1 hypothetical protein CFN78_21995 [Amycolatopsis antarctica]
MNDFVAANVALLNSAFDAFNRGDTESCLERMASGFLINLAGAPAQLVGREAWKQGVEVLRAGFPDMRMEVQDIFGHGDRVAVRNLLRGTHTGEFQGVPPTGRVVEVMSNEFYRVSGGVIAEEWICTDLAGLMGQIG